MAVTSGFFDSTGGDRKYNATQMSSIFDGIILDGVLAAYGEAFKVSATGGLNISVGTGRAWFNHTWTLNDAAYPISLAVSEALLDRYDTVAIQVDANTGVRANTIVVIKGAPASNPAKPTLLTTGLKRQYALAHILRKGGSSSVTQANITNVVGTSGSPFVTAPLTKLSTDQMIAQWEAQFNEWFEELDTALDGDIAANLTARVVSLENRGATLPKLDDALKKAVFYEVDLGTFTAAHLNAIKNGSFSGLWIGSYWTIGGNKYRIADFNYWLGAGGPASAKPHVVVVPDTPLFTSKMHNSKDLTSGYQGYANTLVYNGMGPAQTIVENAFGSANILARSTSETNGLSFSAYTATIRERKLDVLSEVQTTGFMNYDTGHPTTDRGQFALFRLRPKALTSDSAYWLSATRGQNRHAIVWGDGMFSVDWSDSVRGVRPSFAIG